MNFYWSKRKTKTTSRISSMSVTRRYSFSKLSKRSNAKKTECMRIAPYISARILSPNWAQPRYKLPRDMRKLPMK